MREFSPLDLIRAHAWTSAFFTTFSLSLGYFEAVILDALIRQNVRQNLILADVVGVRAALSEHGARYAGRSYQVEPVAVERGCFHPKLMALTLPEEAHLVIGSGNLTVGGWGTNLECVEHLHPSFAADAFNDTANFLEGLATTDTARHAATEACGRLADDLRRLGAGGRRNGDIRVISSLELPIFDQIAGFAEELGGAERLAVVSPFFDDGLAVDELCAALRLDHVSIHAHGTGAVAGATGLNWPNRAQARVSAVTVDPLETDQRHLHAKVFEVMCSRGRLIMSGSANATTAALAQGRNVELSVVRMQRERVSGWRLTPSTPLPMNATTEESVAEEQNGVLRAVLQGDELWGNILTPFPIGSATVFHLTGSGPKELATTSVAADGRFSITAHSLELESWAAQRLVIRIRAAGSGEIAEGFVFFPDVAEVTRRAGAIAGRLLAILSGTETPTDVAAVMTWFFEHPEHLRARFGGGHGDVTSERPEAHAAVANLLAPAPSPGTVDEHGHSENSLGWRRFMDQVFASFRAPRGRIATSTAGDETAEEDGDGATLESPPQIEGAMAAFDHLFDLLLGANDGQRDLGLALQISQYVCDRLEPAEAVVEGYLTRLLLTMSSSPAPESDRIGLAAAVLVSAAKQRQGVNELAMLRAARRQLLRLGVEIADDVPDMGTVRGFARILTPDIDAVALWSAIRDVMTFQEEVKLYHLAASGPLAPSDFPALATLPEWPKLAGAKRKGIYFVSKNANGCPHHHMKLPTSEAFRLQTIGVGRALNCCEAILLCEEL